MNHDTFVYLDFEFKPYPDGSHDIVSCVTLSQAGLKRFWLYHYPEGVKELSDHIYSLRDKIFVAFNVEAELECVRVVCGSKFYPAGWICLRREMLPWVNSSSSFSRFSGPSGAYDHLSRSWKEVDKKATNDKKKKKGSNLYDILEFCCGVKNDSEYKIDTRSLILDNDTYAEKQKQVILEYCESDVTVMPRLWEEIYKINTELLGKINIPVTRYLRDAMYRAKSVSSISKIAAAGIPLDRARVDRLIENGPKLKLKVIKSFLEETGLPFWVWDKKEEKWVEKYEAFHTYVVKQGLHETWPLTRSKMFNRSDDVLSEYKHDPVIKKYKKTKKMLSDLKRVTAPPGKDNRTFRWYMTLEKGTTYDVYRQHPYYAAYQTVTSRNGQSNKSCVFQADKWMRSLIRPPEGKALISVDFKSQEFWIAAALSGDTNMLRDYLSGDIYMAYGINKGGLPADATSETHPKERKVYKKIVLMMQFMGGIGGIQGALGCSIEKAKEHFYGHKEYYHVFWSWVDNFLRNHSENGVSYAKDGHFICNNRCAVPVGRYKVGDLFTTTTANWPIQTTGQVILRVATMLCELAGLKVVALVHDQLVFEVGQNKIEETCALIEKVLNEACKRVFPNMPPCGLDFEILRSNEVWTEPDAAMSLAWLQEYLQLPIDMPMSN